MTNNKSAEYEWCDGLWQGKVWGGGGYVFGVWRITAHQPTNTLGSEFKIIDQIFGQTHRKKRAQEQTMETMHNWVSLTCRCRSKPWRLLALSFAPLAPSLSGPPLALSLTLPLQYLAMWCVGCSRRNGDECQCIKFIQWLLQLFFFYFHDSRGGTKPWASKGGLSWQGRQINCKTCNKTRTSQMCV